MKLSDSKWPIVAADPSLITLEEMRRRCGSRNASNLRRWIMAHGFSFQLARMSKGNQLCLVVPPATWARIKAHRQALGFKVR